MPQIPAAIAAALTSAGFTAAGGAAITSTMVSGWMLSQAIGIGVTILTAMLLPKPRMEGGGITTQGTAQGADKPRKFILGYYATDGNLITERYVYDIDKDDNKYLTQVIAVSDSRIDGYEEFRLSDTVFNLRPQLNPGDAGYHFDDQLGQRPDRGEFKDFMWVRVHDGTQTTASDVLMLEAFVSDPVRPTNANFRMTGVAYMIVTTKYLNRDPKYSGLPEPRAVVRGRPLYDPRKDSSNGIGSGAQRWGNEATYAFTANPVVMIYNLLRGITVAGSYVYGAGAKAANLPLSNWIAAMNVCDEDGSQPSSTNWKDDIKRYRAGIEISVDEEPLAVIEEILKSCGGTIAMNNGNYYIAVGPPSASVRTISDDDILYDAQTDFIMSDGINKRFNAINATYPNPRAGWESEDANEFKRDDLITADGKYLPASLNFNCVPWPIQVRRLMRETLNDSRRLRQHTIVLPPSFIDLNPTDNINWTSLENGYINKKFEVSSTSIDPVYLSVTINIRERDPSDYDFDAVADGKIPTVMPTTPVRPANVGVKGFSVSAATIGGNNGTARRPIIRMEWSTDVSYSQFNYEIRNAVTKEIFKTGTVDITTGTTSPSSTTGVLRVNGVLPATSYEVRAKPIKARNPNVLWGAWLTVTTTSTFIGDSDFANGVIGLFESAGMKATRDIASRATPGAYVGELAWSRADNKLYRWNGTTWIHFIQESLTGILDATAFASNIRIPKFVTTLPTSGNVIGDMVVRQSEPSKIYTWTGSEWKAEVAADQIVGKLTATQIGAAAIGADQIAAGAIVASKLAISDYTNLVPDSELQDVQGWTGVPNDGSGVLVLRPTSAITWAKTEGDIVYYNARNTANSDVQAVSAFIPVSTGDVLYVAGQMARSGSGTKKRAFLGINCYAKDKTFISGQTIYSVNGTSNSTAVQSNEFVVPTGAYFVKYRFYVYGADTDSNVIFASPIVRFKNKGELIVDGTITGNKVVAGTITGGLMSATGIISKSGQIDDLVVKNSHLQNATITALKIGNNALYVPYQYSYADIKILKDTHIKSAPRLLLTRTINAFEGGGFSVNFDADMDSIENTDCFGSIYMTIDGAEVARSIQYGMRTTGADTKFKMPVNLIGNANGGTSTVIRVYAYGSHWNSDTYGSKDFWLRNMTLSIQGSRR